jgi:8-oxo-dGTP pyrophosphatase MutT (NUDIX family)
MSLATLRERLRARLIPPDAAANAPFRSDYDLNGLSPPAEATRAAAVLVLILGRPEGATVILTRRADTLVRHTGQIAFPGGRLDPGETAVEAAMREAWEEVGLEPEAIEVLGCGEPYRTGTGFLITPVVAFRGPENLRLTPAPAEVAEIFETPWDFLMDPANHRQDQLEGPEGPRRFWAVPWTDRYIWGATAGVLRALYERLYGDEIQPDGAVEEDAA